MRHSAHSWFTAALVLAPLAATAQGLTRAPELSFGTVGAPVLCEDLACVPQACLATWLEAAADGGMRLYAATWAPSDPQALLQPVALADAGVCPQASAAGDHFIVSWNTDLRIARGGAIEAVAVSLDGGLAGAATVYAGTTEQSDPVLASNAAGTTLFAYTRYEIAGGADRLHVTLVAPAPAAAAGGGTAVPDGGTGGGAGGGGATGGGPPLAPGAYEVLCGCAAGDGAPVLAALLLALLRRRAGNFAARRR